MQHLPSRGVRVPQREEGPTHSRVKEPRGRLKGEAATFGWYAELPVPKLFHTVSGFFYTQMIQKGRERLWNSWKGMRKTERLELKDIIGGAHRNETVQVSGMVHAKRPVEAASPFLKLRKRDGLLQCTCGGAGGRVEDPGRVCCGRDWAASGGAPGPGRWSWWQRG